MVLVEGMNGRSDAEIKKMYYDWIAKSPGATVYERSKQWGEGFLLIDYAVKNNIPVGTSDPPIKDQTRALLDRGFEPKHIAAFFLLRGDPPDQVKATLEDIPRFSGVGFAVEDAKNVAKEIYGDEVEKAMKSPGQYIQTFFPPPGKKYDEAGPFQQIFRTLNHIRDIAVLQTVHRALQTKTVFIQYGSSHLAELEPALRMLFDPCG